MQYLEPTEHTSYCPFKGHARYWTIRVGEHSAANAVWAALQRTQSGQAVAAE